jgi:hypothetical protein
MGRIRPIYKAEYSRVFIDFRSRMRAVFQLRGLSEFQDAELSPAESCRFQEGPIRPEMGTERLLLSLSVSTEPLI